MLYLLHPCHIRTEWGHVGYAISLLCLLTKLARHTVCCSAADAVHAPTLAPWTRRARMTSPWSSRLLRMAP